MSETKDLENETQMPQGQPSEKTGITLIAAERLRQISDEKWTPEHDDAHIWGELAKAAACYAVGERVKVFRGFIPDDPSCPFPERPRVHALWPWEISWWKPRDQFANLVKAGALIAAELDRLLRAKSVLPVSLASKPNVRSVPLK